MWTSQKAALAPCVHKQSPPQYDSQGCLLRECFWYQDDEEGDAAGGGGEAAGPGKWSKNKALEEELLGGSRSDKMMRKLLTAGAKDTVAVSTAPKGKNRSSISTIAVADAIAVAEDLEAKQIEKMGAGAGVWSVSKTAGAHKLILVAPDQVSKDLWMKKLRRGIEASLLDKYVKEVKYTDLGDPYLAERKGNRHSTPQHLLRSGCCSDRLLVLVGLYGAADTGEALSKQMDALLKAIIKSPDNTDLLKQMTELSQVQAARMVGAKDNFDDFAEDEVEKTIITAEGCDIYGAV